MTVQQFSDEFDVLLNSYAHTSGFGEASSQLDVNLNEYEKSVFLSSAQEDIVKELYSGKYTGDSFESSEQIRRELDYLVNTKKYTDSDKKTSIDVLTDNKFTHTIFTLPEYCMYIVYEQVSLTSENTCINGSIVDVKPVTHDEYIRIRNNSFRGPNTRRVLRLDKGNLQVELISIATIGEYIIKYVKKPDPIILVPLTDEEGQTLNPQTCKLNESLHRDILERAVRMALISRTNSSNRNNGER